VLVGATVSGILLALFMTNAGAAWSQARARVDAEPGSEMHAAVALGDAVGNPMKDAAGPALNILVKLMAVIALVLAPWFLSLRGQEVTPPSAARRRDDDRPRSRASAGLTVARSACAGNVDDAAEGPVRERRPLGVSCDRRNESRRWDGGSLLKQAARSL
jgi:hypothetical protein